MDKVKAKELEKNLKGKVLNRYIVIELINNGKSAAVFKAKKDDKYFAIKIFDDELVEKFGYEIQTKRIEQEITLKDHSIDNLVKIFEGGQTLREGHTYFFLVMEFIDGVNLKDFICTQNYDQNFVLNVLKKLNNTANELLEKKKIAHRDIKPENIMVTKGGDIVLMDLGVLKLIGAKSFSDEEEKSFVGTLRYAPPEFLRRTEEDTEDGWRSVNLYQIGATLHDLIMKQELFLDKNPYSNLVIAIKDDNPKVSNAAYSYELLQLTRDLMTKDWRKRLELCSKTRILNFFKTDKVSENSFDVSVEEIFKMRSVYQSSFDEIQRLQRTKQEKTETQKSLAKDLSNEIEECFNMIRNKAIFNVFKKSQNFKLESDLNYTDPLAQNCLYELEGELRMGFPSNLIILTRTVNTDSGFAEIYVLGVFPSLFLQKNASSPIHFMEEINKIQQQYLLHNPSQAPRMIEIFKGTVNLDDSFRVYLRDQILRLIVTALKKVEYKVKEELQWREKTAKSNSAFNSRTVHDSSIIIDEL